MNIANILTTIRIILVPIFMYMLLEDYFIGAMIIFVVASITDFLDGYVARKLNLVTNLGKFLDPLADKILILAAFIALVEKGYIPSWSVLIIASRELIVSIFRAIAADKNIVIAASIWGKLKTVSQMISVILLISLLILQHKDIIIKNSVFGHSIVYLWSSNISGFVYTVFWISLVFTVISGFDYIWSNRDILREDC